MLIWSRVHPPKLQVSGSTRTNPAAAKPHLAIADRRLKRS